MNRNEAIQFFSRFYAVWPNADLPDVTVEYWVEMLRRSSVEHAMAALEIVTGECKFFPSVAEWQSATRRTHERFRTANPAIAAIEAGPMVGPKKMGALLRALADQLRMDRGEPARYSGDRG